MAMRTGSVSKGRYSFLRSYKEGEHDPASGPETYHSLREAIAVDSQDNLAEAHPLGVCAVFIHWNWQGPALLIHR
jgi:hypothetical protein